MSIFKRKEIVTVRLVNEKDEVAVIITRSYGAGWSSWGDNSTEMIFDADIAECILNKDIQKAKQIACQKYPDNYHEGLNNAVIQWVTPGDTFSIRVYDGKESIEFSPSGSFRA